MVGRPHRWRRLLIAPLVVLGILLIPSIFAPKPRPQTYEMTVVRALVSINTAQTQYFSSYGRYATSLTELGPPSGGAAASTAAADLIPTDLALGTKYGYRFSMIGSPKGYAVNAAPLVYNSTGRRSFFTDESTVIREHLGKEPASANDPEIH